ncbi:dipeptidase [Shewanella baltica]|uniref:dipeptidase n=1 Tax=Shewanella baltica TaxID=62322 RepID=UPI003218C380
MSQSGIQHARVRRALSFALLTASSWVMPQCIAAPASVTTAANTIVPQLSPNALKVADYAVAKYDAAMVQSLTQLVSFNTQAVEGQTPDTNPAFVGFKSSLKQLSQELGLDYADHGYVVLIGLDANSAVNNEPKKLGIVTHGDVQPANPALWAQSPYLLDTQSEPGKLIGRGTEDDKGAIVTAMYAMKAIKDKHIKRDRRIELLVYLAEESDWEPLKTFLASYTPADMNITIDAEYPVVTAEKGWSKITFTVPNIEAKAEASTQTPTLTAFSGGYFASQVPQQAEAEIEAVSPALLTKLQTRAAAQQGMKYRFENHCVDKLCNLHIFADGKAAHSSTPEDGVNAVTHLAALLSPELNDKPWPKTSASLTVAAMNELVGLGIYAEQFGDLAYKDDFMGPLTLAPTVVVQKQKGTEVTINLRRPVGKTPELLAQQAREALALWQDKHQVQLADIESYWGEPMVMKDAPQQQTLLDVFAHFTGIVDPKPVAIGGSTNSKLFPNALSFGPAMPGVEYTGHTEKEFITHKQFMLNLKMYTAAFIELSAAK